MNIAILAHTLMAWDGGVDFLHLLYKGVERATHFNGDSKIYLFIPYENRIIQSIKSPIRKLRGIEKNNIYDSRKVIERFSQEDIIIRKYNCISLGFFGIVESCNELYRLLRKEEIDIVFPISHPTINYKKISIPYIAYYPDFQERYLPNLFTAEDIDYRKKNFQRIADNAEAIMVNSKSVIKDIRMFYPLCRAKLYSLPFSPVGDLEWLDYETSYEYDKYFLISNQFWKHKDHVTALKAFELFYKNNKDVHLVCTGEMKDYRDEDYIEQLVMLVSSFESKENIHFTGFVSKKSQVSLMKGAIALIQPTQFEGGPGGGSVYDALSLGVPCIVSNIEVNREIEDSFDVVFFELGNSFDLALKMEELLIQKKVKKTKRELLETREKVLDRYSNYINSMIMEVINSHRNKQ